MQYGIILRTQDQLFENHLTLSQDSINERHIEL